MACDNAPRRRKLPQHQQKRRSFPSPPCHRFSRPRASSNGRNTRKIFHALPFLRHGTDIIIRKILLRGTGVSHARLRSLRLDELLRSDADYG
jgi:hypothetical protein